MELSIKIVMPIMIVITSMCIVMAACNLWQKEANTYITASLTKDSQPQLALHETILAKSYPIIEAQNVRIHQGEAFAIEDHVRAVDHQDGDITAAMKFYGKVDVQSKGVYTIRCVVRNSYGLKTVKHIQVLVD